jgi:hypothetical protein
VRDCRLYRFYGWDPRTNYTTKTLIYIGETVREPFDRLMEHVARKPWADTVTSWEVDDRVFAGKADVLAAEKAAVEAEKPLYNDEWNRGNRRRVDLSDQERQRWARDAAAGKPPWRASQRKPMYRHGRVADAVAYQSTHLMPDRRVSATRRWSPLQVKVGLWSTAWTLIAVTVLAGLGHYGMFETWKQRAICGLTAAPLLLLWSLRRPKDTWPLWRRRLRKVRRALSP